MMLMAFSRWCDCMQVGTFLEGAITVGYASDATDAAVHANIVAVGYK